MSEVAGMKVEKVSTGTPIGKDSVGADSPLSKIIVKPQELKIGTTPSPIIEPQPKKVTPDKPRFDRPPILAAPILPPADTRDKPVAKKPADEPKPKPNFFKRHWRSLSLSAIGIVGSIFGIAKAYDNYVLAPAQPIHQDYESPTFDPSAGDTHMNVNNSAVMTLDQFKQIAPLIWNAENGTMTIPLPIKFRNGRIPTLHIVKMKDPSLDQSVIKGNDLIQIDNGLQEGDVVFSPYNARLIIMTIPNQGITPAIGTFFLDAYPLDQRNNFGFGTTPLLLLPDPKRAIKIDDYSSYIDVKENEPIGRVLTSYDGKSFNPQIQITGLGHPSLLKNFDLATTSGGQGVILK